MDALPAQYNPKATEDKGYEFWEENNYFSAKPNPAKKPFCIVVPPPNITGILHMGHALNNTFQDILIRYHRMKGEEALWMPGTDHAGIATQNVVERKLSQEGLKRQDLGREKFLEKVWLWKEQYGSTIIMQLKKLGASCDWQRLRFTMDESYSESVKEVFIRLYEKGLIYQGSYIINWCPRCQTALSDEEAAHQELEGNLYYIKYPLQGTGGRGQGSEDRRQNIEDSYIVVATTRPETMLGDTAVAVNPKDKRYKKLIGQTVILPLVERQIKIISDSIVDMKFGTGAVKVTPAHDPNDYEIGQRHSLEFINIMHPDGVLNINAGRYAGMDRFEARKVIIEDLRERELLLKVEPHKHAVGHCYRCHTIVEPYLSKQWFVKMRPLAKPAIEAVKKGKIKFHPLRWTKTYLNWMENIRDWCISRQIWWGHRLPVYYCRVCQEQTGESAVRSPQSAEKAKDNNGVIVSRAKPDKCPECGSRDIYQDEDVLDTWFSSWLWPFATFYWPPEAQSAKRKAQSEEDLKYFYPTSVLVTAPEIIFFWVARMIMAGFEFIGKEPFKDVYIHGTVRDLEGKKMSKSLGNIIDPLEIVEKFGADALRFSLMSLASTGQDIYLSTQKFELGRNFANKLWNASRFSLTNLDLGRMNVDLCVIFKEEKLELPEKWILSRFYSMLGLLNKAMDNYCFNEAASRLYGFIWHELCDWYIELAKPVLVNSKKEKEITQIVLYKVLEKTLRCLHPFMPFVTEEIWQKLNTTLDAGRTASIMTQPWPHIQMQIINKEIEKDMQLVIDVITMIRNLKSQMRIAEGLKGKVVLVANAKAIKILNEASGYIVNLARLDELSLELKASGFKNCISAVTQSVQVFLQLEGLVDIGQELAKLSKEIEGLSSNLKNKEARLKNKEFLQKAPAKIIEKEKVSIESIQEALIRLRKIANELQK